MIECDSQSVISCAYTRYCSTKDACEEVILLPSLLSATHVRGHIQLLMLLPTIILHSHLAAFSTSATHDLHPFQTTVLNTTYTFPSPLLHMTCKALI